MTVPTHWIQTETENIIRRRYKLNQNSSLRAVYDQHETFTTINQWEIKFAFKYRQEINRLLSQPQQFSYFVQLFREETIRFTLNHNQFIRLENSVFRKLETIYTDYVKEIINLLAGNGGFNQFKETYQKMLNQHFVQLHLQLDQLKEGALQDHILDRQVVCAEYSPALQMDLFQIKPECLLPPVLDLGCGYRANLVSALNQLGIPAYGVDRFCLTGPYTYQGSWFDSLPWQQPWGTILSHMAFSHHFRYAHHTPQAEPYLFAKQYKRILDSLKTGGSFYYTPDLPFIEPFLAANQFKIKRFPIPNQTELFAVKIKRLI